MFTQTEKNNSSFNALIESLRKVEKPIWFLIFPENKKYNTRSKEILALNRKFTIEHKLPEFSHVLIPKIEMTHAALCSLMEKIDAIYDITIAYRDCNESRSGLITIPTFNDLLREDNYEIHVHMKRIPIDELIRTDLHDFDINSRDKTAQFLINLFYKKDKNLDIFYRNDLRCTNEICNRSNSCTKNINFLSVLPGVLFFSSISILLLNTRLGRRIFIKTYTYSSILTYVFVKTNSYLKRRSISKAVIFN